MRAIAAAILALSISSQAIAAEAPAPLAPGKPAGVQQAAIETGGVIMWVGILGLAGGIAAIASTTQGSGSSSSTGTK
ncbi:MAG TPA: hypothetical protein VFQ69_01270 [Rhizomicrobium sp.]|jgi:hypothetical protein|nr:hypothetical protein [Rhizomicrobium sp.]